MRGLGWQIRRPGLSRRLSSTTRTSITTDCVGRIRSPVPVERAGRHPDRLGAESLPSRAVRVPARRRARGSPVPNVCRQRGVNTLCANVSFELERRISEYGPESDVRFAACCRRSVAVPERRQWVDNGCRKTLDPEREVELSGGGTSARYEQPGSAMSGPNGYTSRVSK